MHGGVLEESCGIVGKGRHVLRVNYYPHVSTCSEHAWCAFCGINGDGRRSWSRNAECGGARGVHTEHSTASPGRTRSQ